MNLNDIKGQEFALKRIQTDVKKGRLSGAYLLTGPSGVGKKLTAISFAKVLNCKEDTLRGCNKCSSCLRMEKGNHPNLRIVTPEGESIKIEQIRSLKAEAGYKIYEGRKRVWIIDEAEKLTQEASNSLLKIMEEPPGDLILILITHVPRLLPPTVISRCKTVQFSALSRQHVSEILRGKLQVSESLIQLISQLAQGSVSEALRFIRQEEILQEREAIFRLVKERRSLPSRVFKLSERWCMKENQEIETLLNMVLFFLRDILMLKMGVSFFVINQDKLDELIRLKDTFSFSEVYTGIEAVNKSKTFIQANVSTQLVLEGMWMRILYPEYT